MSKNSPTEYHDSDFESDEDEQVEEEAPNTFGNGEALIVEKILGRKYVKDVDGVADELYFIKWKSMSYLHASWERKEDIERVDAGGKLKIKRFLLSPQPKGIIEYLKADEPAAVVAVDDEAIVEDDEEEVDYFNPDMTEVHRIIACDTLTVSHASAKHAEDLIKAKAKKRKSSNNLSDETDADPEGGVKYLVKWRGQPYDESTWERWDDIRGNYEDVWTFWQQQRPPRLPIKNKAFPTLQEYVKLEESPLFGKVDPVSPSSTDDLVRAGEEGDEDRVPSPGLKLRDYQLEGVNWLLWNWWHKRACILADEMGLGKTIQTIGFLHQLRYMSTTKIAGPFLIIAPLSLVDQWQSEIAVWSPSMNTVLLHGNTAAREMIIEREFYHKEPHVTKADAAALKRSGVCKFHILLTTFEVAIKDIKTLSKINWQVLIVDEAHKLKNPASRLFQNLQDIPHEHCLLLTGTPLQNKTEELWALLNFADNVRFKDMSDFLSKFGDLKDASHVARLHDVLKPYLLRRIKEDVEKSLPPKEETIVEVALTAVQKRFYKAIYEKNTGYLFKGLRPSNQPSLMNVMMELRKCCNHPYLVKGVEERVIAEIPPEELPVTDDMLHRKLIESSGKLVLLDKLLPRLFEQGHKVLIFSQMVRVLNLLEDFLRYKGYSFERLDGSTKSNDRKEAVERFCKPSMKRFVMLLSTKAGGLGLNLVAADTVIIFDSDWNPQNDLQAQARAHRIGQQNAVMVYRLLTRKTYEMEMFHQASMKLGLDRAVLAHSRIEQEEQAAKAKKGRPKDGEVREVSNAVSAKTGLNVKEIDELLKRGAYDVFREDDSEQKEFVEADIDSILQRRSHKVSYDGKGVGSASTLGSFSKASFVSSDEKEAVDINDPDFWKKAIGLKEEEIIDALGDMMPQMRVRKQTQLYGEDTGTTEEEIKESLKPLKSDKPTKSAQQKEQAAKEKQEREEAKANKLAAENAIKNDPIQWGPHARDRVLRALNMYGFGRWERIKNESGNAGRDPRGVERFSRAYILQCGLSAADQDHQAKNDTDFVRDAINAAKMVDKVVKSGARSYEVPVSLMEERFLVKLRQGLARKSLNKLDVLTKLINLMQKLVEDAYIARNVSVDLNTDLDELFADLTMEEIVKFMPLGDVRPSWSRIRDWWDLECDVHLLLGVFRHGHGRYDLLRDDLTLVFNSKLLAAQAAENAANASLEGAVAVEGDVVMTTEDGSDPATTSTTTPKPSPAKLKHSASRNTMNGSTTGSQDNTNNNTQDEDQDGDDNFDQDLVDSMDLTTGEEEANHKDANNNLDEDGEAVMFTSSGGDRGSGLTMPDARSINRLFSWLVGSDAARFTKGQVMEKQKMIRKSKSAEAAERREAKLRAEMEAEEKALLEQQNELSSSDDPHADSVLSASSAAGTEQALLTRLYDYLDSEAVSAVYKPNILGLKKCESMFALSLYGGAGVEDPSAVPAGGGGDVENGTNEAEGERATSTVSGVKRSADSLTETNGTTPAADERAAPSSVFAMDVELLPAGSGGADGETVATETVDTSSTPLNVYTSSFAVAHDLTEFEAVRLCCSFVLFGAPVSDALASKSADEGAVAEEVVDTTFQLPNTLLNHMGIHTSDTNSTHIAPYDWSQAVSRCQIKQSPDKLQHFYSKVWLPFCHSISARKVLSHSQHKLVVPNPLLNITEHHYAARGLCHLFLIRQQLLRAAQYVLTHDVQLLIDYLRSPAGRNVDNMPLWWCPWIHDLGVLIGLVKYGFLSLREMKSDADLPFTPAYLDTHVRQVFLFGSSSMLPCGSDDLSTAAESEQFVQAAVLMFPEYRDLECRVMRILEDVTRGLPVEQHAYKVQSFQALRLVAVTSSSNTDDVHENGEGDEDGADHTSAAAAPSGRSGRGAKKDFPLSRSGRAVNKYPAMPLKRFQRETAKRRKLCVSISHPECFKDLYSTTSNSTVTTSSSSTSSVCGSVTTLMETSAAISVEA